MFDTPATKDGVLTLCVTKRASDDRLAVVYYPRVSVLRKIHEDLVLKDFNGYIPTQESTPESPSPLPSATEHLHG